METEDSNEKEFHLIEEKLEILQTDIEKLDEKMDKILEMMDKIIQDTQRMDLHITFIEDIYEKIKSPFHFLMKKTENIQGYVVEKASIIM